MAEKVLHLDTALRATLDANGEATATAGPGYAFETWSGIGITVTSTSNATPTVKVYLGQGTSASALLDGTYDGRLDNARLGIDIPPGQKITIEWTGGDPGAECTASLYGTRKIRER